MKINNPFYLILNGLSIFWFLVIPINTHAKTSLMIGAIQFPQSIQTVPTIRIYSCGKKIPLQLCMPDHESKQFMFHIPQITMQQTQFHILVTPEIHFSHKNSTLERNTIDYLKVPSHQAYAFYELTLAPTKDSSNNTTHSWTIDKKNLDTTTGKIPDEAIIICYDPSCIDSLSGGSTFELPTINFKPNLLTLLGSEHELQKLSNKMLLSAIDSDTVHATIRPRYQQKTGKKSSVTLVAPVT